MIINLKVWWHEFKYWNIYRRIEKLNMFIGKHLPYSWRMWVLVFATVNACGDTKSPCEVNYSDIYKGL